MQLVCFAVFAGQEVFVGTKCQMAFGKKFVGLRLEISSCFIENFIGECNGQVEQVADALRQHSVPHSHVACSHATCHGALSWPN